MRGFVVLVVMLMLAVISAVAVGQLSVVSNQSVVSVRREEEAQARAIAEGCLLLAQRHAERFMGAPAGGPVPSPPVPTIAGENDFDRLLNPDGNISGPFRRGLDEHVPSIGGGVKVNIPGGTLASGNASDRQYLMLTRGPAGKEGACFIRYEDNSDDDLAVGASLPDGSDNCRGPGGIAEGTGTDINYCDRDGAIYMTAIGVYPKLGTAQETYARAHARVTLRKLFQVAQPGSFPSAVMAGGNIDIKNNISICGVGGVQANDVFGKLQGSSCMCGSVETTDPTGTPLPLASTCSGCNQCSPGSQTSGNTAPRRFEVDGNNNPGGALRCVIGSTCAEDPTEAGVFRSPMQPQPTGFMSNRIFGDPMSSTNNLGSPASCKFFFKDTGEIFYWDMSDNTVLTTLGGLASPAPTLVSVPNDDCTAYANDPVETPCTWTLTGVTCSANETPCWKPLANLDGVAPVDIDFSATGAVEQSDATGRFLAITSNPLPNAKNAAAHFGGAAANRLCGGDVTSLAQPCLNCGVTGVNTIEFTGGDYRFTANANNNNLPVPMYMAVGPSITADVIGITGGGTPNGPLLAGVTTIARVNLDNNSSLCCPTCGCTELLTAGRRTLSAGEPAQPPGNPGVECYISAPNQPGAYPNALLPSWARFGSVDPAFAGANAAGALPNNRSVPGFVVFADQGFAMSNSTFAGVLWGAGNQVFNGASQLCVIGRWVIDGDVDFANNSQANIAGEFMVTGNMIGNANSVNINADVAYVEGNADFKNNWHMNGRFIVGGNLEIKNNAIIRFFGGGSEGSFGSSALSTFMESQW